MKNFLESTAGFLIDNSKKRSYTGRSSIFFKLTSFIFFLTMGMVYAQTPQTLDEYLEDEDIEQQEKIKSLIYDMKPSIFLNDGNMKISEEGFPQRVITDVASLSLLGSKLDDFRTVKFLQIQLVDAGQKSRIRLNPEQLSGFLNLSIIYINSQIPLSRDEVRNMVSGYQEGDILLLFQVNPNF